MKMEGASVKRSSEDAQQESEDQDKKKVKLSKFLHPSDCVLHAAIYANKLTPVVNLLEKGEQVCTRDGENCFFATNPKQDNWPLIKQLLKFEPEGVHAKGKSGETLLMAFPEQYEYLMKLGADPFAKTNSGGTVLLEVMKKKPNLELIKKLIELGVEVDCKDNFGQTALSMICMQCVKEHHAEIVQVLLAAGANPNAVDDTGRTVLMYATMYNRGDHDGGLILPIVKLLVEHGADINVKNQQDESLIFTACRKDQHKVVEFLIQHGAHASDKISRNGISLLMIAIRTSKTADLVNLLLSNGANPSHQDCRGISPLMIASQNSNTQFVNILLEASAEVNAKNGTGKTALHFSATSVHTLNDSQIGTLKRLVKAGGDVFARDRYQVSPVFTAMNYLKVQICYGLNVQKVKKIDASVKYLIETASRKFKKDENACFHPDKHPQSLFLGNTPDSYKFRKHEIFDYFLQSELKDFSVEVKNKLILNPVLEDYISVSVDNAYGMDTLGCVLINSVVTRKDGVRVLSEDFTESVDKLFSANYNAGEITLSVEFSLSSLAVLMSLDVEENDQIFDLTKKLVIEHKANNSGRHICHDHVATEVLRERLLISDEIFFATLTGKISCLRFLLLFWNGHPLSLLLLFYPEHVTPEIAKHFLKLMERLLPVLCQMGGHADKNLCKEINFQLSSLEKKCDKIKTIADKLALHQATVPNLRSLCCVAIRKHITKNEVAELQDQLLAIELPHDVRSFFSL